MADDLDPQSEIILRLGRDPILAHRFLFPHRHTDPLTPAHEDFIRWFHSPEPYVVDEGFRGFGKSSLAEEGTVIKALYKRFKNGLVIGGTQPLAQEHLTSIASELISNERINDLFGDQIGDTWGADMIVLSNGVAMQAISKGQKLRGTKYKEQRPDYLYGDDIEDDEDARTPEARKKVETWFFRKLLPACAPPGKYTARIMGTRLDPESLLAKLDQAGWVVRKYPLEYIGDDGQRCSTWPQRFPMEVVDRIRASYERRGAFRDYEMEYQCVVDRPEDKAFKAEMFRVEPQVRTWQAVYHMWDPARTVGPRAADTGFASWSWFGPKLVVWNAFGRQLMPDQIVAGIFNEAERDRPVWVGAEEDGLNEWLKQPLRQESVKRGFSLPITPVKAPTDKRNFIRGLQPFFMAREAVFAVDLPDLKAQLLSFPSGKIDVPNALAYALKLRPGAPMYDDFGARHVAEELRPAPSEPCWLCLNAGSGLVTGQLVQVLDGAIRVYADWVKEGEAAEVLQGIIGHATLEAGRNIRLVAGPQHFDQFHNFGLRQAARQLLAELRPGVPPERGRAHIRNLLQREHRHMPMLLVNRTAVWTANGFAAGYARALLKQGMLAEFAEEGAYRLLMEGLESFCGLLAIGATDQEANDSSANFAYTGDGRRYRSAMIRAR